MTGNVSGAMGRNDFGFLPGYSKWVGQERTYLILYVGSSKCKRISRLVLICLEGLSETRSKLLHAAASTDVSHHTRLALDRRFSFSLSGPDRRKDMQGPEAWRHSQFEPRLGGNPSGARLDPLI